MATAPTDESILLFKLLGDGRWHSYPLIKAEIAKRVSPGRAIRAYELRMKPERKQRNNPNYNTLETEDERIEFGKNDTAQATVSSWTKRGIQSWGSGDRRIIRVKPGFMSYLLATPAVPPQDDQFAPGAYPPGDEPPEGVERPLNPPVRPSGDVRRVSVGPGSPLMGPELSFEDRIGADVDSDLGELILGPQEASEPVAEPVGEPVSAALEPVEVVQGDSDVFPEVVTRETTLMEALVKQLAELESREPLLSVTVDQLMGLLPACPECGLPVRDFEIHRGWHERQSHAFAGSQPSVSQKIFDDILDGFQLGMQKWLLLQFSQLEAKIQGKQAAPARWRDGQRQRSQHRD